MLLYEYVLVYTLIVIPNPTNKVLFVHETQIFNETWDISVPERQDFYTNLDASKRHRHVKINPYESFNRHFWTDMMNWINLAYYLHINIH